MNALLTKGKIGKRYRRRASTDSEPRLRYVRIRTLRAHSSGKPPPDTDPVLDRGAEGEDKFARWIMPSRRRSMNAAAQAATPLSTVAGTTVDIVDIARRLAP